MNDKEFLLVLVPVNRLRALAEGWGHPVSDGRLGAPGIAKALARKRSLTLSKILAEMTSPELAEACKRVGLSANGSSAMRALLEEKLAVGGWRALRREAASSSEPVLVVRPAELRKVIDGDTLLVLLEGEETYVRVRGIDTPETGESDKAEADLDRSGMAPAKMKRLGKAATERTRALVSGRKLFLTCQLTPMGPKRYLHHRQHRLLAFVALDSPDGPDLGHLLLAEGYALVWPRNVKTRRYLHVRSEEYTATCHAALRSQPGLWKTGLDELCPRRDHPARRVWTLDDCRASCLAPA